MADETYYKKVGKRYRSVSYYDSNLDRALPKGAHLILVDDTGKITKYGVDAALAPLIAAGLYAHRALIDAMTEVNRGSLTSKYDKPFTKEQLEAWEALKATFEDEPFHVSLPSYNDIADAGINKLIELSEKMLTNESVRLAYEQFMFIAKLSIENSHAEVR